MVHRLEADTLERVFASEGKCRAFETFVDGDIIVRADGQSNRGGVLYQVEFRSPGEFAAELGAEVMPAEQIRRQRSDDRDWE